MIPDSIILAAMAASILLACTSYGHTKTTTEEDSK